MPESIPDDVMDHMANAMVEPGLMKDTQALFPSGTRVRRMVLERALEAAAQHSYFLQEVRLGDELVMAPRTPPQSTFEVSTFDTMASPLRNVPEEDFWRMPRTP